LVSFFEFYWKTEMFSGMNLIATSRSARIEVLGQSINKMGCICAL
jgi:hypothetical protein